MLSSIGGFVRRHDPERFVTALFAPPAQREALFALYALNHELARAREVASVPALALIRLQWWREVVQGADRRHDVATPLRAALAAGRLEPELLLRMIDAREWEVEEIVDAGQWRRYLHDGAGTLMQAAGLAMGATEDAPALRDLGAACGAVGLLRNATAHASQGRWTGSEGMEVDQLRSLALEWMGRTRRWSNAALPAALPAVFARQFLRRGPAAFLGGRVSVWIAALSHRC